MTPTRFSSLWSLLLAGLLLAPVHPASAQARDSTSLEAPVSPAKLESFVKAHLAIAALRSQTQAELAEPKSKKVDQQVALRQKLHADTERVLKQHELTEAEFAHLTRRVSTDDALRKSFDDAVARLSQGKGG